MMINKDMGIYIHIPFCVKKCNYCDFLSFPGTDALQSQYIEALLKEIRAYAGLYGSKGLISVANIDTIFIGGGTPSLLPPLYIHRILTEIYANFNVAKDAEITIECNPTANHDNYHIYRQAGINRISIGLQSANDRELKALGRIHNYKQFTVAYNKARQEGFDNINIDVMSALPAQSLSSYKNTLSSILELEPEHISAYSLIIEEGTPFYDIYNEYKKESCYPPLPDEDTEREMYYLTKSMLADKGYNRYEISNYAKPFRECKHNLRYWERKNYLGFGLGASSYIEETRFKNTSDIPQYIEACKKLTTDSLSSSNYYIDALIDKEYLEILNTEDSMAEFMFLGLRKTAGIRKSDFFLYFKKDIHTIYSSVIEKHKKEGLLVETDETLYLSDKGLDLSNYIFSDFIL